ncbi:MAG: cytochrome c [Acidobacteriota bacterium]
MTTNRIKISAIGFFAVPLLAVMIFTGSPITSAAGKADDPAAVYKAKCAMCHTATASKFFDASKADADLVKAIMDGKKGEKPPFMPEFKSKGMTEADAQGLVTYMKTLKTPAN